MGVSRIETNELSFDGNQSEIYSLTVEKRTCILLDETMFCFCPKLLFHDGIVARLIAEGKEYVPEIPEKRARLE